MTKPKKNDSKNLTSEERVKELEKKLQYVEVENESLKKLNVVVKRRVEQEKRKKQKKFFHYDPIIPHIM